jgi:hypothetical protein
MSRSAPRAASRMAAAVEYSVTTFFGITSSR